MSRLGLRPKREPVYTGSARHALSQSCACSHGARLKKCSLETRTAARRICKTQPTGGLVLARTLGAVPVEVLPLATQVALASSPVRQTNRRLKSSGYLEWMAVVPVDNHFYIWFVSSVLTPLSRGVDADISISNEAQRTQKGMSIHVTMCPSLP